MPSRNLASVFLFLVLGSICTAAAALELDENRYLLLDSRIIADAENVELELGEVEKEPSNPLFEEEYWADPPKKWEPRYDNLYPNVMYDEEDGLFKIWYKCFVRDAASERVPIEERPDAEYSTASAGRRRGILYAYSENGVDWIKPNLGLVEFEGDTDNNIVILDFEGGVFKDEHEDDPTRRYKMFGRIDADRQMAVVFSEDGVRWDDPIPWPEHNARGDAHNNAIWASSLDRYVGITRGWDEERIILRTESEDFVNWSDPVEIMRAAGEDEQTYSMPIFHYANVYLGLPAIFHDDDTVDTELAWSPDTKDWRRIKPGEPLIPRGGNIEEYPDSDYDAGCIYASVPVIREQEILLYYGGSNYYHSDWRESSLNLARMRLDRFAGYLADDDAIARIRTTPFVLTGGSLKINADVEDGGSLRAAVLDENGDPLEGYALEDFPAITSDAVDAEMRWDGADLSELEGEEVSFHLEFENAKVYSLAGGIDSAPMAE